MENRYNTAEIVDLGPADDLILGDIGQPKEDDVPFELPGGLVTAYDEE